MDNDNDEYGQGWKVALEDEAATKAIKAAEDKSYNESQTALESGVAPAAGKVDDDASFEKAWTDANSGSGDEKPAVGQPMKAAEATAEPVEPAKAAEPAKVLSFKETFAAARLAGKKDFGWIRPDGTHYRVTTLLKGEAKPSQPAKSVSPAPSAASPVPAMAQAQTPSEAKKTTGNAPYRDNSVKINGKAYVIPVAETMAEKLAKIPTGNSVAPAKPADKGHVSRGSLSGKLG